MPDIWLSGNLPDNERWPDIQPDTGYPAIEISRISGIRPKKCPTQHYNKGDSIHKQPWMDKVS